MPESFRRPTAATLMFAVVLFCGTPFGLAAEAGSVQGRVLDAADGRPLAGATVHLVADGGDARFSSAPSSTDGRFDVASADAGRYNVVVETAGGAYALTERLPVDAGTNRAVAIVVRSGMALQTDEGFGGESAAFPAWAKWLVVGIVGGGALFVINEISDDETSGSPF